MAQEKKNWDKRFRDSSNKPVDTGVIEVVVTGFLARNPSYTSDEVKVRVQGFASGVRHCAEPNCQKPAWGDAPNTRGRFNFEKHVRAYHPPPLKTKTGAAPTPTPRQQKQLFFTLPVPPPVAASSSLSAAVPTSLSLAALATEGQDASAGETVRHPAMSSLALSLRTLSLPLTPIPPLGLGRCCGGRGHAQRA